MHLEDSMVMYGIYNAETLGETHKHSTSHSQHYISIWKTICGTARHSIASTYIC